MFRTAARLPRLAVALTALSLSVAAQAATFNQALTTDGQWFNFTVDALSTADEIGRAHV